MLSQRICTAEPFSVQFFTFFAPAHVNGSALGEFRSQRSDHTCVVLLALRSVEVVPALRKSRSSSDGIRQDRILLRCGIQASSQKTAPQDCTGEGLLGRAPYLKKLQVGPSLIQAVLISVEIKSSGAKRGRAPLWDLPASSEVRFPPQLTPTARASPSPPSQGHLKGSSRGALTQSRNAKRGVGRKQPGGGRLP